MKYLRLELLAMNHMVSRRGWSIAKALKTWIRWAFRSWVNKPFNFCLCQQTSAAVGKIADLTTIKLTEMSNAKQITSRRRNFLCKHRDNDEQIALGFAFLEWIFNDTFVITLCLTNFNRNFKNLSRVVFCQVQASFSIWRSVFGENAFLFV